MLFERLENYCTLLNFGVMAFFACASIHTFGSCTFCSHELSLPKIPAQLGCTARNTSADLIAVIAARPCRRPRHQSRQRRQRRPNDPRRPCCQRHPRSPTRGARLSRAACAAPPVPLARAAIIISYYLKIIFLLFNYFSFSFLGYYFLIYVSGELPAQRTIVLLFHSRIYIVIFSFKFVHNCYYFTVTLIFFSIASSFD
jgi:hypothetical protein